MSEPVEKPSWACQYWSEPKHDSEDCKYCAWNRVKNLIKKQTKAD